MIPDMVMGAKSPTQAWNILTSMVEDQNSNYGKESAKKSFELLAMIVGESAHEFVARAKGLVKCCKVSRNRSH